MNIKTLEISGVTPVVIGNRGDMLYITDRYWWIRNKGDSSIYASLSDDVTAGADGTAEIPAGEVGMLEIDRLHSCIYLNGSGGAEIRTASEPVCPFKSAAKGGESRSAGGSSAYSLDNAVDYPLLGLTVYGKSVQDGVPTPENPVKIISAGDNGFDIITKNDNHFNLLSVRDNGGEIITKQPVSAVGKVGNIVGITVAATGTGLKYQWQLSADKGQTWKNSVSTGNNSPTISLTISPTWNGIHLRCVITDANGKAEISNNAVIYVVSDDCEINTASITASVLPLCGIPVESGGNYIDSNGRQWICDELIYNADGTGKIIKHTGKIDSYNSETITIPYISTTGSLTTGAAIIYQLAEPQEMELTAAEMTALRQLQTYSGAANIFNSGGAEMNVKYCTNKMLSECVLPITTGLQKQIDELQAAILSLGSNV